MFKKSPALFLLIFVVLGIIITDHFRFEILYLYGCLVVVSLGTIFLYKQKKQNFLILAIGLIAFFFVAMRFASLYYETSPNHIANYADKKTKYIIYGSVSDWPDINLERTALTIEVDSIASETVQLTRGKILLKINSTTTQFQRGDKLIFRGRIYPVEGESFSSQFNYSRYLRYKEIAGIVYQTTPLHILYDKANSFSLIPFVDYLRNVITSSFNRNLSPVSASLASGFLIGETRDIPVELYKNFKNSGTLHLLAVSGSNVILVITFFSFLFKPVMLSKNKRAILLLGVVLLFSLLSYGEPSVLRASLMAVLVLGAGLFERKYQLSNIIAVSALIILIYAPSQLFDIGFQLSFVIAWGLILVVPKIQTVFEKYKNRFWYKFLLFPFLVSCIAQVFSIGLIGLYFKQIPLISPLANLFVVPLVSIAVIGILVLLVADMILPVFGLLVGSILNQILEGTVYLVQYFSSDSMPLLTVYDWTIFGIFCYYVILFMIPFAFFSKKNRRLILYSFLIVLNIFVIQKAVSVLSDDHSLNIMVSTIPGGSMSIVNLEHGEGDVIINGIQGKTYQIDEKIMIPQLQKEEVLKIRKLFLLKSDFNALDDIIRLSQLYNVDTIYLTSNLIHSFSDQVVNLDAGISKSNIIELNETHRFNLKQGYSYFESKLIFNFQESRIFFLESLQTQAVEEQKQMLDIYYITNYVADFDSLHLVQTGVRKIICSKVEQPNSDETDEKSEISTNILVDLYKVREFQIHLPY